MKIGELMVPNPICAEIWQPLSFIRQTMLESSFSYLPIRTAPNGESAWKLVSDVELARYLRTAGSAGQRNSRLVETLAHAQETGGIKFLGTRPCGPEDLISDLFKQSDGHMDWGGLPILVVRSGSADLLGILTAFDLL